MEEKEFKTIEERGKYLDKYFPERKATSACGVYKIKKGYLTVFLNKIRWGKE